MRQDTTSRRARIRDGWAAFGEAVDPSLLDDPRYATNRERVAHRKELIAHLAPRFARKTTAQWTEVFDAAGVPCGPIRTIAQVFSDPHVLHRGLLQEVDHPTVGRIKQTGLPVKLSQTPGRIRSAPPTLGQHTDAILRELGLDAATIASLRKEHVV